MQPIRNLRLQSASTSSCTVTYTGDEFAFLLHTFTVCVAAPDVDQHLTQPARFFTYDRNV